MRNSINTTIRGIVMITLGATAIHAIQSNGIAADSSLRPVLAEGVTLDTPGLALAFHDEFDGGKVNTEIWDYRTDSKGQSTQLPVNVTVSSGVLRLELKKETAQKMALTGAGLISKSAFKYGYYEARFKTPRAEGWHSSFWLMAHDGSGGTSPKKTLLEIDICENDSKNVNNYSCTVHRWNPPPKKSGPGNRPKTPDLSSDFHVWGCEYTPKTVRFFFDGKQVHSLDIGAYEHDALNIWLTSIAFPDANTNTVDASRLPASMEFDYVRYYAPSNME